MKSRFGFNRPPPRPRRHYEGEPSYDSYDSFAPPLKRRDLPPIPRGRHSPYSQRYFDEDYDTYDGYSARHLPPRRPPCRRRRDGNTFEEYNEFDRWSRYQEGPSSSRVSADSEGYYTDRPRRESSSSVPKSWPSGGSISSRRSQPRYECRDYEDTRYQKGRDFREEIDSDSWYEEQLRRQPMMRKNLPPRNDQVSVRQSISRSSYNSQDLPVESLVHTENDPGSTGTNSMDSNAADRPIRSNDDSATVDDDPGCRGLQKSRSTFSDTSRMTNPQLLHAKSIPELPDGYLQRKDGVIISYGSSVASARGIERYATMADQPEQAAEIVVENLRSLGYKIDERNGILGSNSDSGNFSRYGGAPSRSESFSQNSEMGESIVNSAAANSTASRAKSLKSKESDYGILSPPTVFSRAKTKDDKSSTSSASRDSESVFRAKVSLNGNHSLGSRTSQSGDSRRSASVESRSSGRKLDSPAPIPPAMALDAKSLAYEDSQTKGFTGTNGSTMMADVSTWTTRIQDTEAPQEGTVLLDANAKAHVTEDPIDPPTAANQMLSVKRVEFSGEFLPMTSNGGRVPELVMNSAGLTSVVSELTNQQSMGATTMSSLTFQPLPINPMESLLDKIMYSCRISACPSSKR